MTPTEHLRDLLNSDAKYYSKAFKHTLQHSLRIKCIQWIQSAIQTSRAIMQNSIHPSKWNILQRDQVLYLAISLLDRFFDKVQPIHSSKLLLLSATCLWVASKLEDLHPVSASFLAQQLPTQYPISQTKKLLVQFESMLLFKLEYHLDVTHPFNFAYSFLTLIPVPTPPHLPVTFHFFISKLSCCLGDLVRCLEITSLACYSPISCGYFMFSTGSLDRYVY